MDNMQRLMAREDQQQISKKSIVEHIKNDIKDPRPWIGGSYGYLQNNKPQGTRKCLTNQQLADFGRKLADIMIPYYQDQEVTAGTKEFFSVYEKLGDKEKEFLAYDFFFADPNDAKFPLNYRYNKEFPCGRRYVKFQNDDLQPVLSKSNLAKNIHDNFIHLRPLGYPEDEIARRIYINTTPENATQIALELFKKCAEQPDGKNCRPYVKFFTEDTRNDTMLAYCTEKNFDLMFDLIHEIYQEHQELFNGTGKLSLTDQIFDTNQHVVLGVADEPTVEGHSFNELFCDKVIEPFKADLGKKLGVDEEGLSKLSDAVIDQYVTYDNLKPYIEKTCFSVDYPFLTKATVKNQKLQAKKIVENQTMPVERTQGSLPQELADMGIV